MALLDAAGHPIQRAAASQIRAYDAGKIGRRLAAIPTVPAAINAQIRRYGRTIVARSRWLVRNNAYAAGARESFVSAMVGAGIVPLPRTNDETLKEAIEEAFRAWTDEADADWHTDLYGMQAIIAGEVFEAGECFVRFRGRLPEDGLTVPLQLQLLPSEMLDVAYNLDLGNGRRIECGIEFDPIGRRVAYHFWPVHPGTDQIFGLVSGERVRVLAEDVIHVFRGTEPGQVRGVPHTVSAIGSLTMLELYDDAELERKRTAALFGGFIKTPAPDSSPLEDVLQTDGTSAPALQPGAMVSLAPGEEIQFAEPADVGGNYEPFQYRTLTKISRGFGAPYSEISGDLSKSTYSSDRSGLVTHRRRIEAMQHGVMVYQLCRPVWNRWLDEAVLAGALPITPAEYQRRKVELRGIDWLPPAWDWVDPLKDVNAEIAAMNNYLTSRSRSTRQRGYDAVQIDRERKADQDRALAMGLPVEPIGTVRTTVQAPPEDAQPADSGGNAAPNDGAQQGKQQK